MIQAVEGGFEQSMLLGVGKNAGKIREIVQNLSLVVGRGAIPPYEGRGRPRGR